MNIILCGLPKCGKTTIGKRLAEKLEWNFIDTDQLIEKCYTDATGKKKNCRQIFLQEGEERFRELEKVQIAHLNSSKNSVISLGGGALNHPENIKSLRITGEIVYLKAPVATLWDRIKKDTIPAFLTTVDPEKEFYWLAEKRMIIYEATATMTIDTNYLNVQEIVNLLVEFRNQYGQ